jgi:septin family protein
MLKTDNLVIEENGVKLRLNIVDTPGYGDQVNNDRWYVLLVYLRPELIESAGILLLNTSRTSTQHTFARN